jgi:phytoene desaturase
MSSAKKVIIIGGGLAGLTAGALLAKKGLSVQLFEARDKAGGCCATTNVQGFTFNDGALCLILPDVLDHAFSRLGLERTVLLPLRKISHCHTTTLPDGAVVTMGEGLQVGVDGGREKVDPAQLRAELEHMLAKWAPVLDFFTQDVAFHPFSLQRVVARGWRHLPKFYGSAGAEIKALFSSQAVRAAFSGALLFNGVPPEEMPVSMILGLVSMLREGYYLPEGGMGRITEVVRDAFVQNGGEIYLNAKIERIAVKDGQAVGVQAVGMGFVEGQAVLSTTSGMATFLSLLSPEDAPAGMRRKAQKTRLSYRSFVLQLGLSNKVEAPSHFIDELPFMDAQRKLFADSGDAGAWLTYSVPTVTMPELAPPGGSLIELFMPVDAGMLLSAWDEEARTRVVERAIQALSRRYPLQIAAMRSFTPRDFQEKMHLYQGALYGLSPAAGPLAMFPHQTPLPGLFLAGQTTFPGFGVVAAAMSGVFAGDAILKSI